MQVEILDFTRDTREDSKVYGHVSVRVKDSFICWLVVLKNSKGGYFFCLPSVRIEGEFKPAFEFTKMDFGKEVNAEIKSQFELDHG